MPAKKTASKGKAEATTTSTQNGHGNGSHSHGERPPIEFVTACQTDIIRRVQQLADFKGSGDQIKAVREVCGNWLRYANALDRLLYPMMEQRGVSHDLLLEHTISDELTGILVGDVMKRPEKDKHFTSEVKVLLKILAREMEAKKDAKTGVAALAKQSDCDFGEVADEVRHMLMNENRLAEEGIAYLQPRFLRSVAVNRRQEEHSSMRGNERERDDRGRFVEEDDRRQYRGSSQGRGGRHEHDERGWHGDSRGHSEAAQRGWDDRRHMREDDYRMEDEYRRRSGTRSSPYEDDDRRRHSGWYGDSEGHSEASRRGWDNPDHGRSGWYGDSEGHREASRRGWDNPDHGPSGWYGDSEGHRRAAQRGWDNPDHGPSGWYGDPDGHSQASRRGWDEREGQGRSRRDEDDDRRRYRRR